MTVVAAVSLFNGVMLLSDCRVTVENRGKPDLHSDTAQKIFPLTPTTVIGFSGNVDTASRLLLELFRQASFRRKRDPISLLNWFPRFFKSRYSVEKRKRAGPVDFILGSVVPGRPNVVERQKVADLLNRIARAGWVCLNRNFGLISGTSAWFRPPRSAVAS